MKAYLARLAKPLEIIPQVQGAFWTFILVTVVLGQAGILLAMLVSLGNTDMTFHSIVSDRLVAGSFYTFSISMIASRITPFVIEYLDKTKEIRFRHIKVITSLVAVVLLLLPMTGLFVRQIGPSHSSASNVPLDKTQLCFYILSIGACLYLFCVSCLHYDYDTYAELDQEGMARLRRDVASKTKDSRGNAL